MITRINMVSVIVHLQPGWQVMTGTSTWILEGRKTSPCNGLSQRLRKLKPRLLRLLVESWALTGN
jgi:hypothetical protein